MYVDDFIGLSMVIGIMYGIFILVKKVFQKLKEMDYEKKKIIFDSLKIFLIGIMVGLLFYLTPMINEDMKLFISVLATLGTFIGAFTIKEINGYNFLTGALIFTGQVFFGITLLLLMINTNLGYSPIVILTLFTLFSFYLTKQFGKLENKILFIGSLVFWMFCLLSTYMNGIDSEAIIIALCMALVVCEFFKLRKSLLGKGIHNILITVALLLIFKVQSADGTFIIFWSTLVCFIAILGILAIFSKGEKIKLKSLIVYLPFVVTFLLTGFNDMLEIMVSVYNLLAVAWLLSEKSIYKKILVPLFLLISVFATLSNIYADSLVSLIIMASVALTFVFLFEPKKAIELKRGVNEDEE